MMLLTIVILFKLMAFGEADYIRELYNVERELTSDKINELSSMNQKLPFNKYINSENCDKESCYLNINENFNLITRKGYGINFFVNELGLMNESITIFVSDVNFNVSSSYMYTTTLSKSYYRVMFKNYDSSGFANCMDNIGLNGFATAGDLMLSGTEGKDWTFSSRKSVKHNLGPYSSESLNCGHYWLTTLEVCVEKAIITRLDKGISTYKLDEELSFDLTVSSRINGKEEKYKYTGDFNQPIIWELNEKISLELNPIGILINPLASKYVSCIYNKREDAEEEICYIHNSSNEKGNIAATGIGKFQMNSWNEPEKLAFDNKRYFPDEFLYPCNRLSSMGKFKKAIGEPNQALTFGLSDILSNKLMEDVETIKNVAPPIVGLELGDVCCMRVYSVTDKFLDNTVSSMQKLIESEYKYGITSDGNIIIENGIPKLKDINFKNLLHSSVQLTLLTKNLPISISLTEHKIDELIIPEMVYYKSGAGSYFKLQLVYLGTPGDIKINSNDINILTKEIFIHKSGKFEDTIGFKSIGELINKPLICVDSNNHCTRPAKITYKESKDNIIDDEDINEGSVIRKSLSFFSCLYFSNIYLSLISLLWTIINIVCMIILFVMIAKVSSRFIGVLCCMSYWKEANSMHTNVKPPVFELSTAIEGIVDSVQEGGLYVEKLPAGHMVNDLIKSKSNYLFCYIYNEKTIEYQNCGSDKYCYLPYKNYTLKFNTSEGLEDYRFTTSDVVDLDIKTGIALIADRKAKKDDTYLLDPNVCSGILSTMRINDAYWIKVYPTAYYMSTFGIDTIKLVTRSSNKYITLVMTNNLLTYNEIALIDMKTFGNYGNYHMVSYTIAVDSELNESGTILRFIDMIRLEGDLVLHSSSLSKFSKIEKITILIQCKSKCSVWNMDKNFKKIGRITLNKYYEIVDKDKYVDLAVRETEVLCKKMTRDNLLGEGEINWKFEDAEVLIRTANSHKVLNNECKYIKSSHMYENLIFKSSFMVDNNGVYKFTENGPIETTCYYTVNSRVCYGKSNTELMVVDNRPTANFLDKTKSFSIKIGDKNYQLNNNDHYVTFSPHISECNGNIIIDSKSSIYCTHDCCAISEDNWRSFGIIKADEGRKFNSSLSNSRISMWKGMKSETYALRKSSWCDYDGFTNSVKCLLGEFELEFIFFITFPIITVLIYYIIVMLLMCLSKLYLMSKGIKKVDKYSSGKKLWLSNVVDNMMKGELMPWRSDSNPYKKHSSHNTRRSEYRKITYRNQ